MTQKGMKMTEESQTNTEDTTIFAVFGMYRDRQVPQMISAIDRADASRQYHDQYPGWEGTVLTIKDLADLIEVSDGR